MQRNILHGLKRLKNILIVSNMPDFCMCQDHECHKKDTCKRYISKPFVHQSYGEFKRKFEECYWEVKKVLRDFIKK